MKSYKVGNPLEYMASLCKSRLKRGGNDNYHIFLNSVEGIAKILRMASLPAGQCRIVCALGEDNKKPNIEKLPSGFEIKTTTDPVRMFNFYTSTCFEGQDIYDEKGRTFIVSEPDKDHTKMDIMTTLVQICGRIRNSGYNNEITQIYGTSPYKDVSREEYKAVIDKKVRDAEHDAEVLNNLTDNGKELMERYFKKAPYIDVVDGKIVVDRNMANYEMVNYDIVNGQYRSRCNMNASLLKAGFTVTNEKPGPDKEQLEPSSIERTPFKDIFEEYVELSKEMFNLNCFRKSRIEVEKPLVKEAYEKLGADKVREMNYHQSNIKRELIKLEHETLDTKIFLMLDGQLPKQVAIPRAEIKENLEKIYQELKVMKAAKATDLNRWYYIKPTSKRSKDGSVQSCLTIVSAKFKK